MAAAKSMPAATPQGRFKPYPKYKDSSVEWLGKVPDRWQVTRLGQFFFERREKVSDKDFAPLSVTKNGVVPQLETAAKTDDGDNRKLVRAGDFVINGRSDRKGSSGLSELDGSVSLINIVLEPSGIHGRYVHYLLRSYAFQEEFYRYGKGIVADLWSTNYSEMKNILLAMPEIEEQRAIAGFLDRETVRVDALIEKQQRLIELLKEKRQAVISHAVTKGLNPNAPMKDSGIPWLGKIPAHWEVIPFSHGINFQEGPGILTVDFKEEGIPLLRVSGVQGRWATLDGCNYLDPKKVLKRWNHFRLSKGDLIISASASMGTICEIGEETEGAVAYTGLIRLTERSGILVKDFIRAIVESHLFYTQIDFFKAGATIQHFGPTHLAQMKVLRPSIAEQEQIVIFLDQEIPQVDKAIEKSQTAISLLQEHRVALITAAVTGKIDVRQAA